MSELKQAELPLSVSNEPQKDFKKIELPGFAEVENLATHILKKGGRVIAPGIVKKADANIEEKATVVGIAANDALLNQEVTVIIGGKAKGLKDLQVGKRYYLGASAMLTPDVPLTAIKRVVVGIAFSLDELIIQLTPDDDKSDTLTQQ